MARNTYRARRFRCLEPSCAHEFVSGFWATKLTAATTDLVGTFNTRGDIRCPRCSSHRVSADQFVDRMSRTRHARLRESMRPVVYRWHDPAGHEHFRYPATNDAATQRAGEERVEFDTLRGMELFLKEQNPGYRDWQVPLNDILDYDEARIDTAIDETDPGLADDIDAVEQGDGGGITSEAEIAEFMARDDARGLIESL